MSDTRLSHAVGRRCPDRPAASYQTRRGNLGNCPRHGSAYFHKAAANVALPMDASSVPKDEIATAIARCAGALLIALRLGKVSIAERPESRRAVRYDCSTHIFFDR